MGDVMFDTSKPIWYNKRMNDTNHINDFPNRTPYCGTICLITGKIIGKDDKCRWTDEFDTWISEDGQEEIEKLVTFSPEGATHLGEAEIIYSEWYAKDAASDANESNAEFRRWHK
jgi:hypothetical protein